MSRMPSAVPPSGPQPGMHMQPVHSAPVITPAMNLPNPMTSGMSHPVRGMPLPGPHEREHVLPAPGPGPIPGHLFPAMGVNPNAPHHLTGMMQHGHPHQFNHHPMLALNRLSHFIGQPELRIFEMNKRLQQRLDDCDSVWWDSFVTDFFEDDATLTLGFNTEDGPKRYTIGRALIPRYFRSIFESGCGELYYNLRLNHEYFHHPSLTLNSELATMTMIMVRSIPATIVVEGRFTLEFTFDELMRIRSWYFHIRSHRELIMRSMLGIQDPAFLEQLSKNSTWYGMTSTTLNFFRLCVILEPMQELMSRQKAYSLTPRDCLKTTLFQKWQRIMPQESTRQPSKRRKRKGSAAAAEGGSNNSGGSNTGRASKRKQSPVPIPSHHMAQPGDVMIVGEPTLMGGDFGDEDERLITRLENTQYDATAVSASPHMHPNFPCPSDGPPGLISSPIGTSGPVNSAPGPHPLSSMHFRGPTSCGPTSHPGMMSNEGAFSNSLPPMPPHPSSMPVSMIPGQPAPILSSAPGRPLIHNAGMIGGQPYPTQLPSKSSISGGNTPSSRELYQTPVSTCASDSIHQPARSNSASSLFDGGNGLGGFASCPSPNMLPSRNAARFTPPTMPNGLGMGPASGTSQPNFIMPPDMVVGCPNSLAPTSMSGAPMSSPLPTSYTPDAMDSSGAMHGSMSQCPTSIGVKTASSPLVFGCMGANGNQVKPESSLSSMMMGSGNEALSAIPLNDGDDLKPPAGLVHHKRSNSESV